MEYSFNLGNNLSSIIWLFKSVYTHFLIWLTLHNEKLSLLKAVSPFEENTQQHKG